MDSRELDKLIDELKEALPDDPGFIGIGVVRQDWRPFWALAKEIQAGFSAGVRYPTKELRQAAWERLNALRDEASRRGDRERDHLSAKSKHHRDAIFGECKGIGWSQLSDDIWFFDKTTVEQMKSRGQYLGKLMQYFSEHKTEMLPEDKSACHERIQEIKEEHDNFWAKLRESNTTRSADRMERCQSNLEKNRERYRKASEALSRFNDRASELRDKIAETDSEKWSEIWSGWLSETEAKINDIEASISQIEEWIEEDGKRLASLK